jgi:hypothetical protein
MPVPLKTAVVALVKAAVPVKDARKGTWWPAAADAEFTAIPMVPIAMSITTSV